LRLVVPAGSNRARMFLYDLTAGETEFRQLTFADGAAETVITSGESWSPPLAELDALVLRLGGGAQVASVLVENANHN
ncbi:MAG: hypothetical protein N2512_03615, partial [Armatimonadetes bacterium]|nr:hypothetical protein [Armatimonadota bacterium]